MPVRTDASDTPAGGGPRGDPVDALIERLPLLRECRPALVVAIESIAEVFEGGGTLLICGNGGSAADSEHLVADLMKSFALARPIPVDEQARLAGLGPDGADLATRLQGAMPAIALASNGAFTTAMANDVTFDMVFAQQVYGLGRPGDALLAISTTGNSMSVVNAAHVAHLRGMRVIALTGRDGGDLSPVADVAVRVPADQVHEIQELHLPVYHTMALVLERRFFGGASAEVRPG